MKVWNALLVEVNGRQGYVIDQNGQMYRSWADYFEKRPLGGLPVNKPVTDVFSQNHFNDYRSMFDAH
jgi:hypothetical protein